ncbi:MAG: hypothetical protein IIX67_00295, partial [Clostridia bacterium]|nr:hypothetical protein [Clostridia bacterium]
MNVFFESALSTRIAFGGDKRTLLDGDSENKNKWYSKGVYTINEKKGEVHITELPPSWEFEKY